MELNIARQKYKNGEITFKELDAIFFEKGTDEEIKEFCNSPVFDRPMVVEGLNQKERDNSFNSIFD
jgi:hypothetical protein